MESTSSNHERVTGRVTGRVQGVGFRAFTRREARRLGLTGWVRNEPDGTVRFLAEGPRDDLDALVEAVRQGPRAGTVERVQVNWMPAAGTFQDFSVQWF